MTNAGINRHDKTPEDVAILNATAEEARKALAALLALFREIVVLREMHELSYREIASVTNLPIGTVMSRPSRATIADRRNAGAIR